MAQEPILGDYWAHDPSTMIKDGSRYYVFRTSNGIMPKWSTDKVHWNYGGQVFPSGPPAWVIDAVPEFQDNTFWAPDIAYFNGKYHLYYSCSSFGKQVSAIGLVTSPSLNSPSWVDQGPVIQSSVGSPYNCIDPGILVETNGSVWMVFGSYWNGIYLMQLDPTTGLRISPNSPLTRLADNSSIEASYLVHRGSYYYLFVNHGSCCSGVDSTYEILVGRSPSITGPYRDRNGASLLSGGGTMVLESTGRFIGPGHAGIMTEDATDWFTYHYYDGLDRGVAKLGLARLQWTPDGWPVVSNEWSAFYTFEADAREHLSQFDGQLTGNATVASEPNRGSVLQLDGSSAYVDLPLSVANAGTFAAWVKWNGGGNWQRIFDFGDGTSRYLFLSPRANSGKLRFAITVSGGGNEQIIEAPSALPTNSWTHVAVTLEPGRGLLYLNGAPVGTNSNMTLRPWQVLARSNYLGKSQWPDPLFNGRIDSFRIFGRALSGDAIRDLAHAQPTVAHRYSFTSTASDSVGTADGSLRGSAVVTNNSLALAGAAGDYVDLPGGLVSGCSSVTLEFWATFGTNGDWARVFDFGNSAGSSGQNFLFFSPHTSTGSHRFGISTPIGTRNLDGAGTLDGRQIHVVCIADPAQGYMGIYTNGILEVEQIGSPPLLSAVSSALGYLGHSLFSSHAWLDASIDDFRIYDGRLTPEDVAADYLAGPDALAIPVSLNVSNTLTGLVLSWPAYAVDFRLESSQTPQAVGSWSPVAAPPTLKDDWYHLTVPPEEASQYFRLRR